MSTNDHNNINPPGIERIYAKNVFATIKQHSCKLDQNPSNTEQVENPSRIKNYSWWNTVIRSGKMHFMYLSTESTIVPPGTNCKTFNIKG